VVIRIIELLLIIMLLQAVLRFIWPAKKRTRSAAGSPQEKRFDAKGQDISDADFKEIKK
jgi:hypothetical protein